MCLKRFFWKIYNFVNIIKLLVWMTIIAISFFIKYSCLYSFSCLWTRNQYLSLICLYCVSHAKVSYLFIKRFLTSWGQVWNLSFWPDFELLLWPLAIDQFSPHHWAVMFLFSPGHIYHQINLSAFFYLSANTEADTCELL